MENKYLQMRAAALGFWPGADPAKKTPAAFDGDLGPRSTAAISAATAAQKVKGLPLFHHSGLTRIHWHWTVGHHKAGAADHGHYHWLFEGDGTAILDYPEDQYRPHTLNANGGAIGLSCCGMVGAQERPFKPGPEPITTASIIAMVRRTALACHEYDIPVSRWSTLSHAEVQPTLGITQKGKWDIAWLPGLSGPRDPVEVGDLIRDMVRQDMARLGLALPLGSFP